VSNNWTILLIYINVSKSYQNLTILIKLTRLALNGVICAKTYEVDTNVIKKNFTVNYIWLNNEKYFLNKLIIWNY